MSDDIRNVNPEQTEFDLLLFIKELWNKRRIVLLICILFFGISVVYLQVIDKEYTSYSEMLPSSSSENGSSSLRGLGGLAGLAGFSVPSSTSDINSTIYPEIVESLPFKLQLLDSTLYFSELDSTITIRDYFAKISYPTWDVIFKKYTIGLPRLLLSHLRSTNYDPQLNYIFQEGIYYLGIEDRIAIGAMIDRVFIETKRENGIISVTTTMPDPIASAQLNRVTVLLLKHFITEYRINKAKESLMYIEKSYNEAKMNFERDQEVLASFIDHNQNVTTSIARIERQRLENAYNISFDLYSTVSARLEQAKIRLSEETPVFSVIEPIVAPTSHSYPNSTSIILISVVFGLFVSISFFFIDSFIRMWLQKYS
ncbi:MAG: hypothetical protein JXR10_03645 [Cyclobacteriaceae bacterium]